jgi:hypothetical protein
VEEAEERIMAKQHGLAGGVRYGPALSLQPGTSQMAAGSALVSRSCSPLKILYHAAQ